MPRGVDTPDSVLPYTRAFEAALANRLLAVSPVVEEFRSLIETEQREAEYQRYLEMHPELLDVYAVRVHPRPQFRYPEGRTSPIGKSYVEPDFIIEYPGRRYALVEIERPDAPFGTSRGQPAASVTAPAFQLAEWVSFIREFPSIVESGFPGLPLALKTLVVVSRSAVVAEGRDATAYRQLVQSTFNIDELYFYDELAERAEVALARLAALTLTP
jgi:hypothetical protein